MQNGLYAMSMKPVFKDIQSNRVMRYLELVESFSIRTFGIAVAYQCMNNMLHVTTDAYWASWEEPHDDLSTGSSITSGISSLTSYGSNTDLLDDDLLDDILSTEPTTDVTRLHENGEMKDEWSETRKS